MHDFEVSTFVQLSWEQSSIFIAFDLWRQIFNEMGPMSPWSMDPGPRFNIKMSSNQYRKSRCGDKTVVKSSDLHNVNSYTGKMSSLYWIGAQVLNSSPLNTAYMRQWIWSAIVRIMDCRLCCAKPLSINQRWGIVNWTPRNQLQRKFNHTFSFFRTIAPFWLHLNVLIG